MDITQLLTLPFAVVVLLATGLAMVLNWLDPPVSKLTNVQQLVVSLVSTLVAAFVIAWGQLEAGADIYSFVGFGLVVTGALGGLGAVRAIFNAPQSYINPTMGEPPKTL